MYLATEKNLSHLPKNPNFLSENYFLRLFYLFIFFFDNTENVSFYLLAFHKIFFYNQPAFAFHVQRDFCIIHAHTLAFFVFAFLIFFTRFFLNIFFVFMITSFDIFIYKKNIIANKLFSLS